MFEDPGPAEWDDARARAMIGKTIIIGLIMVGPTRQVENETQMHGVIVEADGEVGLTVQLAGQREGETYTLPPDLRALKPGERGLYTLKSTGEQIRNPDFTTSWAMSR